MLLTKTRLASGLFLALALSGCQSWHVSQSIDALGATSNERKIVKEARNDPFPSPQQVGLK